MEKTYGIWNNITDDWEAEGLTLENARREIDGITENQEPDRDDLEIRED